MSSDISLGQIPDDNAGNTLDTAKNLGTLGINPSIANDFVGNFNGLATDDTDDYQFTLAENSTINLKVSGLSQDVTVDNPGESFERANNLGTLGTTPTIANVKVLEDSINSSFALTYTKLTQFAGLDNFWTLFDQAFGTAYNYADVTKLRSQWLIGDFSQFPDIEVISSSILGNANGAYATSTNKIYLSDAFVASATPETLMGTLLEEYGHFVDAQVNQVDSEGDEGAIFAALVQRQSLNADTLGALKAEDDRAVIVLNGQVIQVEQQSFNDPIYGDAGDNTIYGDTGNDLLYGGAGNDYLIGVSIEDYLFPDYPSSPNTKNNFGIGDKDTLNGGIGNDYFVLNNGKNITFYDDGNPFSDGSNDYAVITDFERPNYGDFGYIPGDSITLIGSYTDYILNVSGKDTQLLINKPGNEPDELIAVIKNQTGLSLTRNFSYYASPPSPPSPALPSITLAVTPASVTEDETQNLVYTFARTGSTTNALTVNYSITGTADNNDYKGATTGAGKTIAFAPGSAIATLEINPTADNKIETDETVAFTLAAGTGYTIGTTTTVIGTITNDDFDLPSISLAVNPTEVLEDKTQNLVYTFTRTGATTNTLTVNYNVGGTATFNTDYTPIGSSSFTASTGSVTFAPGSAIATVTIDPTEDTTVEADETVALTLATGTGYAIGTTTAVTGTITNDDIPKVSVSDAYVSVNENQNTVIKFRVTLSQPSNQDVVIVYSTSDQLANSTGQGDAKDYQSIINGTLTFAPGETTKEIAVTVFGERGVSDQDLEIFAKDTAYRNWEKEQDVDKIPNIKSDKIPNIKPYAYDDFGYYVDQFFDDPTSDFQAVGLTSNENFFLNLTSANNATIDDGNAIGTIYDLGKAPVLVSRGTKGWQDVFSDANPLGIGFNQYISNQTSLEAWLRKVSQAENGAVIFRPNLTGHSLGGALTQLIATNYIGDLGKVVTFNSPGISFLGTPKANINSTTHYITSSDVVSMAGLNYLPGSYVLSDYSSSGILGVVNGNTHLLPVLSPQVGYDATPQVGDDPTKISNFLNKPTGLLMSPKQSSSNLSNFFFTYLPDPDYFAFQIAVSQINPEFAKALTFRGTTEASRIVLGTYIYSILTDKDISILIAAWNAASKFSSNVWNTIIQLTKNTVTPPISNNAPQLQARSRIANTFAVPTIETSSETPIDPPVQAFSEAPVETFGETPIDPLVETFSETSTPISPWEAFSKWTVGIWNASPEWDLQTFTNAIEGINTPPGVENSIVDQVVTEDNSFSFTFAETTFIEIDADDSLTYSATLADGNSLPNWLSFDPTTRTFRGTPTNDNVGNLNVKVTATDDSGVNISDIFAIAVENVNDAPIVENAIADQNAKQGDAFNFQIPTNTFTDIDAGDVLTYSATLENGNALPSWLTFNPTTRTFTGTPSNDNVGNLNVKVTAKDNSAANISDIFAIAVENVNDAPIVENAIADQTTTADVTFSFTFDANTFSDIDAGDNLTYSAKLKNGDNLPLWLKFNSVTRTFSGTPTKSDVGSLAIDVRATDNSGASVTDTFLLDVKPSNLEPTLKLAKIGDDIFNITNSIAKSQLQVTLTGQNSNFVNELGVFTVDDAQGKINSIAPGAAGYTQAALERAKVIFSAITNLPNGFNTNNLTHLLEFNSGDNLRFYLLKNSTTDAVKAGITPLTDILFSDALTQKITDLGNDNFSLAWKDGSGNNAADFNNLVVKIQPTNDSLPLGTNLQSKFPGELIDLRGVANQVKADFTVNREAAFNNFIGFYQVADENGGIDTNGDGKVDILTGQAGYTQAAIRGRVAGIDLTVNNQGTATYTGIFQPGSIFAPFIIANGTPDALLDSNPNNDPAVYFPFLGANADKVDHIRLLGNNIFGFEDLASGGDKDFNDAIARVNLSIV
ncbi:hypothetical protein NIES2100_22180 [Calothrix sp. NIES-2100]|uniref:putative Ig domain-containing protein n=1 Tax=Calothrix sp. NIES-2100 TaxID=1954172 RepID=UPI000B5E1BFD|nr:hypothetical protein NIES2100_22180 [Calothrix sp. NIES-2100]